MANRNLPLLTSTAKVLKPLLKDLVFVGGCVTGLLINDPGAADARETLDVDTIAEIGSTAEYYYALSPRLKELGFAEDQSERPVICRWLRGNLILDVMPTDKQILGFSNRWHKAAMENAENIELEKTLVIRAVTAPYFVATKLEAFKDRGKNDYWASHDLEDLLAVIDGRPTFADELIESSGELQKYVSLEIGRLLRNSKFIDALQGHVRPGPDAICQERIRKLLETLRQISSAEVSAIIYIAPRRARGHVEDVTRSGLQIRSNIAASVGNAAEVRFTPQGQAEEITAAGRVARVRGDRIGIAFPETSSWQSSWRKMVAFRTVSQKQLEERNTPELLIARIAAIQHEAATTTEISRKTTALWRMENLGGILGKIAQPGDTLSDPRLPVEARPIVHVGMGEAAVEVANFDAVQIHRTIGFLAQPEYRLFAYESLGWMLGIYEKTAPRLMRSLRRLNRPDPERFIPLFAPEVQRLISHGYGRLLYFKSKDIQAVLRNVQKRNFLDPKAAMQGAAFGYTMVNHLELSVVLETGDSLLDPELVKAFKAGLVYALEFWEWASPGFLESLRFDSPRANSLLAAARREIAAARVQGWLDPFLVRSC